MGRIAGMRAQRSRILPVAVAAVLLASPAFGQETFEQQFEGFNLSGYNEGGTKAWEVNGDTADLMGNKIKITNVVANTFEDTPMNLTADVGIVDKEKGHIHLQDDVVITSDNGAQLLTDSLDWHRSEDLVTTNDFVTIVDKKMKATGTGIEAHPNLKLAQLNKDVTVNMKPKAEDPETEKITITCDGPLEIDQQKGVAVFNENVVGVQTDRTLYADKVEVYFDQDQSKIKKMVCIGNVKIVQGENVSYSEMATYYGDEQRMVLTGRPKLIMITEGEGSITSSMNKK